MKKTFFKSALIIIALSTLITNKSNAQAKLSLVGIYGFPKTVALGTDSVFFYYTVQNTGNIQYNGPIGLSYATSSYSVATNLPISTSSVTINPGDSVLKSTKISFKKPQFDVGIDIVVVWPTVNSPYVLADSTIFNVTVLAPLTINDITIWLDEDISIFPNPANQFLSININPKTDVEEVRILDVFGRQVLTSNTRNQTNVIINTSNFAKGIYFMEFILEDNKRLVRKFVKD